ncbi:MAG TPA: helix-turn-helix domain-containing protein [Proteiniclasticum sp.]|nr:helix-turn-helix domain-containing protein [Proteiniclasticum sp.]
MDRQAKFNILSEGQKIGVSSICAKHGISRTLYYRWLNRYKTYGLDGLDPVKKVFVPINKTPPPIEDSILSLIKSYPSYGPREIKYLLEEIGHKISESAVYNIMKRHDLSTKEKRTRFAKKKTSPKISDLPAFDTMKSGECWLFWTTSYGSHESVGTIYE